MDKQEILLREYETCQRNVQFNASGYWTVVNIFIAIDALMWAAGAAHTVLQGNLVFPEHAKWLIFSVPAMISVLGVTMICITLSLRGWIDRINSFIVASYFRMHEIEKELGMFLNLSIHWLSNPDEMPPEQQERIDSLKSRIKKGLGDQRPLPSREMVYLNQIYEALIWLWKLIIAISIVIAILIYLN